MSSVELVISKSVAAMSSEGVERVPGSGSKVKIRVFTSGGESSAQVSVRIYWKYGQDGESLIWSMAPGDQMPFVHEIPEGEVDGVNKIGLVLDNVNDSSRYMSGYVRIEED
jgi:hypothetical protein